MLGEDEWTWGVLQNSATSSTTEHHASMLTGHVVHLQSAQGEHHSGMIDDHRMAIQSFCVRMPCV
jgi:hypothetical protein